MGTQVGVARKSDRAPAKSSAPPVQAEAQTDDPLQGAGLSDPLQDPLQHDGEVCEAEQDVYSVDADQDQCVAPPDPARAQLEASLSEVQKQRLRAVAGILSYEDKNGTWATITNYNAITGDIPGRNVWVQTTDGLTADLCWMFDVALVAGGVGGTVGQILGAVGGRLGELIGAVLGQASGGLAYFGGRLIGAIVEGIAGSSWDTFTGYMAGTVNEDNIAGADMALRLAWGNSFGGESLSIRELIHPSVIRQISTLGY
jgi:hypothetical protein